MNWIKFIRIFLLVLIVIGLGLLVTQKIWVPKVVDKILSYQKPQSIVEVASKKEISNSPINRQQSSSQGSYVLTSSSTAITIQNNEEIIKIITLEEIPSFDSNDVGEPSSPKKDYAFDYNTFLDKAHSVVYFSVSNRTTAGNANADRALFSYNIISKKLILLRKEEFSVSFGTINSSNDGNYLVYGDGYHGGLCYNTLGLGIYDLKNNKDLGPFFLATSTIGILEFDHWIDNSSFVYKQETYLNESDCRDNYDKPNIIKKTYQIK